MLNFGPYDGIVIGSGIGGMSAAGLLARLAGRRMLVLERHTQLGGLTHVFRREGASWDVGLHYVGDVQPGSQGRLLMDYLTGGKVRWRKMPEEFEHFRFPGLAMTQESDFTRWRKKLEEAFPGERRGLRAWFRALESAGRWSVLQMAGQFVPAPVSLLLQLLSLPGKRLSLRTTAQVLSKRIRDPRLQALLCATWGDYGLPPEESAFAIHALIATHYRNGAWFPEGGSGRIARAMEAGIEEAGGLCLAGWEVQEILRDAAGKVRGVRARNVGGSGESQDFLSPVVISDAGARATFDNLLRGPSTPALEVLRSRLRGVTPGYSAVTLYLRFRESPAKLGLKGENYWVFTTRDLGSVQRQTRALLAGRPEHAFLSFPSLKNGEKRFHTAEIIAPVLPEVFNRWRDQPQGRRDREYQDLKEKISDGLLGLAAKEIPGLEELVSYRELSTPLSIDHFDAREGGRFYGLAPRPERYRISGLGARTPVTGLYLTGSDAATLGIMGAMMGGAAAASAILGGTAFMRMMAEAKAFAAKGSASGSEVRSPRPLPHPMRFQATLLEKRSIGPSVIDALFELDRPLDFQPGQFARLEVSDGEWRDYSLVETVACRVRFLVSTATGGDGSAWFRSAIPGAQIRLEGPYGTFSVRAGERRRVFVATGTGLAPLLPMMQSLKPSETRPGTDLLLGSRTLCETVLTDCQRRMLEDKGVRVTLCISRQDVLPPTFRGRVTTRLEEMALDPETTDFFLCGAPAMVRDALSALHRRGARHVFTERF